MKMYSYDGSRDESVGLSDQHYQECSIGVVVFHQDFIIGASSGQSDVTLHDVEELSQGLKCCV